MSTPRGTLRERTREAARDHIAASALELFVERGFEVTTVDQIAEAAGISARSFFRYFATKEDVVIGDPSMWARAMADRLRAQPPDLDLWTAMHRALELLAVPTAENPGQPLAAMRVIMSAASLRARNAEKHLTWASALIPVAEERIGGPAPTRAFRASVIVLGAIALFDAALGEWVRRDGRTPLGELLDRTFDQLPHE